MVGSDRLKDSCPTLAVDMASVAKGKFTSYEHQSGPTSTHQSANKYLAQFYWS
jgi:hypothetical protein